MTSTRSSTRRTTLTIAAAIAVTAALAGAGAATASSPARTYTPGSKGLGDPYFPLEGNGGYDVGHYDLDLSYDPTSHVLGGVDTIQATATQNLSRFDLDLRNYRVTDVQVNGSEATFTRTPHELIITPAAGIDDGSTFTVAVSYHGVPKTIVGSPIVFGAPYGWIYTSDGAFVGCEPNAASTWYPSNDHPSDKATFTFDISVPKGTKVVANGDLQSQRTAGATSHFVWNETEPMATYLATVDIGAWVFHQTTTKGGIPEFVAVDPNLEQQAEQNNTIGQTGDITDYWSQTFGSYAFSSTGAIVDDVPQVGFSLETQTRPLYGFVPDSGTMSHELAHQWFGDTVSVEQWKDIWLNEGFATFASWLWSEHKGGQTTTQLGQEYYNEIDASDPFWKQSIADPGRDTMFSSAVYYRGGMALASLRKLVGDDDFFQILRTWVADHLYGNGTTGEFTALASQVSGQNLHSFFRTWLWKQAKPPSF